MDFSPGVRTPFDTGKNMGVQQMTRRSEGGSFGLLETLSPELAKDLGEAFSLSRIGSGPGRKIPREVGNTARGALRLAGHITVFLLVAVVAVSVAVSVAVTAMYLMPLP